ncbi:MAG TPA: S-layer homology domain-containing protein, partial [Peptococcaceae bacterium]|nr:S-layer homology domain-containing protein [Peptococcaceae bacterium]
MKRQRAQSVFLSLSLTFLIILCVPVFSAQAEETPLYSLAQLNEDSIAEDPSFDDIEGHWAEKVIRDWQARQLVAGYPNGFLRPDNPITRAEFIALVNRVFGYQEVGAFSFNDVASTDWFAGEIAKAAAVGYIGGYPDGSVKPNNPITRQEVAAVLARILLSSGEIDNDEQEYIQVKFLDNVQFPDWSRSSIMAAAANGYMSGYPDGTFRPAVFITRAEAISTLDRAMIIKETLEEGQNLSGDRITESRGRKNRDASLSSLSVNGVLVTGFAPDIFSYEVTLPYGTTELPIVTAKVSHIKAKVTISQATTLPGNAFVVVRAENGRTQTYEVSFKLALSSSKSITSFGFATPAATGVIDEAAKTIAVTVPYGTDVTSLTPTLVHTGASIVPASGTSQDFTNPVVYTVTAADATTAQYTVTVTIAPDTDASLTSLAVNPGSIDFDPGTLIYDNVVVPYGTSTVTVTFTAAPQATTSVESPQTVMISGGTGYFEVTVTAGDKVNTKTYTISFTEAPDNDATLSDLKVDGVTISGFAPNVYDYSYVVPYGTATVPTVSATTTDP